jgi:hypothetical protein
MPALWAGGRNRVNRSVDRDEASGSYQDRKERKLNGEKQVFLRKNRDEMQNNAAPIAAEKVSAQPDSFRSNVFDKSNGCVRARGKQAVTTTEQSLVSHRLCSVIMRVSLTAANLRPHKFRARLQSRPIGA